MASAIKNDTDRRGMDRTARPRRRICRTGFRLHLQGAGHFNVVNQWAISATRSPAAVRTFAARGLGFDSCARGRRQRYLAVYAVAKWAAERARRNLGPTLIEHVTYRVGAHSTSMILPYRPKTGPMPGRSEGDQARTTSRYGVWSDERHKQAGGSYGHGDGGPEEAESLGTRHSGGKPSVRDVFEGVYAKMPPHLRRRQQAESSHARKTMIEAIRDAMDVMMSRMTMLSCSARTLASAGRFAPPGLWRNLADRCSIRRSALV
jgi:hypothetical protein